MAIKKPLTDTGLFAITTKEAPACYTCRHGHFDKRQSDRVSRGQGICTRWAGAPPFGANFSPPQVFLQQVRDGVFPEDDYELYLQTCAPLYYGAAFMLQHVEPELLRTHFEWLNWIAKRADRIFRVSWFETCSGEHEDGQEPSS